MSAGDVRDQLATAITGIAQMLHEMQQQLADLGRENQRLQQQLVGMQ